MGVFAFSFISIIFFKMCTNHPVGIHKWMGGVMRRNFLTIFLVLCLSSAVFAQKSKNSDMVLSLKKKGEKSEKADSKRRFLAIGLTAGVVADMSQLGSAITNDGVVDLNTESLASTTGIGKLLMPDKDCALQSYSSEGTNAEPLRVIDDYEEGGPLIGLDTGMYVMYDTTPHLDLPFFVRLGFDYAFKISGGEQMLKLGPGPDQVADSSDFAQPSEFNFEGGTIKTTWNSSWMEVPLTFGVILPVMDLGKVYGGVGVSWFRGGFSIQVDADKKYAAFLTSYDENVYSDAENLMVTEPINETIEFMTYGISFNMLLGLEVFLSENAAATVEYWASGTMQTVYAETEFSDTAKQAMTMATAGPDAAGKDPEYIERFAYPVVLGGSMLKFGVRYYLL